MQRATFVVDRCGNHLLHWPLSSPGVLVQAGDDLATKEPKVVAMLAECPARQPQSQLVP